MTSIPIFSIMNQKTHSKAEELDDQTSLKTILHHDFPMN